MPAKKRTIDLKVDLSHENNVMKIERAMASWFYFGQ